MKLLLETFALAALGLVCGFGVNALSPRPVMLGQPVMPAAAQAGDGSCESPHAPVAVLQRISVAEATAVCDTCSAAFVDSRSARAFEEGHIAGAYHLPPKSHPDETIVLQRLAGYPMVIVYGDDSRCRLAEGVARRLLDSGVADVRVLDGAWPDWLAAGGAGASGFCTECEHAGSTGDDAHSDPDEERQ